MFDRQMAQSALERMSPAMRGIAEEQGRARGMSASDVALEQALTVAQQSSSDALFALKKGRPQLRSV